MRVRRGKQEEEAERAMLDAENADNADDQDKEENWSGKPEDLTGGIGE